MSGLFTIFNLAMHPDSVPYWLRRHSNRLPETTLPDLQTSRSIPASVFFRSMLGKVIVAWCFLGLMAASFPCAAQVSRGRDMLTVLHENHQQRYREFEIQAGKLANTCEERGSIEGATAVRKVIAPPESQAQNLRKLPREITPDIPNNLDQDERFWRTQLRSLEKDYAQDLYVLSRRALNDGYPSYAYSLVRETAAHDPDHPSARKILGFVRQGNEWVTQFAASQIKKGNVWHEQFGWLPKNHLERYARGERRFKDRWVSADKERELRRDFSEAWEVNTDHYRIRTNVSLERGVELGRALEDFHEFFYETFAGFFNTREQMMKLFDGTAKAVSNNPRPYMVHYYRTREEYVDRLKRDFPNIEITNGIYMTTGRTAHFYDDPHNDNEATLFHEGTHQLFFESHVLNRPIGEKSHFWIIEGIACYMESFQRKDGAFSLGDPDYIRFAGARMNLLQKKYYVPLREFSEMGMYEFQHVPQPELSKNYTQASGLARFFMEYDQGRYREALVTHLTQLYSANTRERDSAASLEKLTGIDFEDLDRQYMDDARQTDGAVAAP